MRRRKALLAAMVSVLAVMMATAGPASAEHSPAADGSSCIGKANSGAATAGLNVGAFHRELAQSTTPGGQFIAELARDKEAIDCRFLAEPR